MTPGRWPKARLWPFGRGPYEAACSGWGCSSNSAVGAAAAVGKVVQDGSLHAAALLVQQQQQDQQQVQEWKGTEEPSGQPSQAAHPPWVR
jgi:hypothetical protein